MERSPVFLSDKVLKVARYKDWVGDESSGFAEGESMKDNSPAYKFESGPIAIATSSKKRTLIPA